MNNKNLLKRQFNIYLSLPLYLGILWIIVAIIALAVNVRAGIVVFSATIIYYIACLVFYLRGKNRIMAKIAAYGANYSQVQRQMIHELDVPYTLLDTKGRIMWTNTAMNQVIGEEDVKNKHITALFEELNESDIEEITEPTELFFNHNEHAYRAVMKPFALTDGDAVEVDSADEVNADFVNMYMFDETEITALRRKNQEDKLVAGLIYIDNYDEALQNVEDVRRTMIFALVERKINKYITNVDGIVKKLENDKYFIAVKSKGVVRMQSDKFSLLDDVKSVNMGNDLPITISIGLGMGAETYSRNCEFSRIAMDMALGRGGDQAVVKDGGKIYYYGGKTKSVEKNTRVKARVKALALRELMLTRDDIMVMGHKIGDSDSFGASIGIYRAAKTLNRNAHIVINGVNSTANQMMEKFTEENGYESDLFITGEQALEMVTKNTLLIVVDVNRPSYTDCPELCKKTQSIVVLDHHRQSADVFENPLLSYIEPFASSTCEMVAEIVQYIEDNVRLKQQEADAMYGGIIIDTNNFTNRTGVRTFEAAAFLRRNGADVTRVRKMFRDDMNDYKAKASAIEAAEVFKDQYAISVCPSEGISMPTVVGSQAANELLNIKGIKASFVCTPYNEQIYISARSIDEVNVQIIMEKLGGGGHLNLAGAQLKGCTVHEATELLKETLSAMIEDGDL